MNVSKSTSNFRYIRGDFDRDGVRNIDDKKPFDKSNKERVNSEVSLADTFNLIRRKQRVARSFMEPFAKKKGFGEFRVKDEYSVVNKLVKKGFSDKTVGRIALGDFIGFRKTVVGKRADAERSWNSFNPRNVVERDNKYLSNRWSDNPYSALHTNFHFGSKKNPMFAEAQFRTHTLGVFNDSQHKNHKSSKVSKKDLELGRYYRRIKA